jgi:NitT/TauT family transport system ATP-binding protein
MRTRGAADETATLAPAGEAASDAVPKIEVRNAAKAFHRGRGDVLTVFQNVNFKVEAGEFVCIIGPSGCGKTTMLTLIAGLAQPTGGDVLVEGRPVTGPGRDRGVVFQQDAILMWRTVRKNVQYGLEIQGIPKAERDERVNHYLRLVGLEKFADFYPKELSGGMKKRVAIAAVLANRPAVMLMDEPFGSLDYPSKVGLQEEILDIFRAEQTTTIFVTHDIEEAIYLGDRILVFDRGGLAEDVQVGLPRPRVPEMRTAPELQQLKSRLWEYL